MTYFLLEKKLPSGASLYFSDIHKNLKPASSFSPYDAMKFESKEDAQFMVKACGLQGFKIVEHQFV